MKYQIGTALWEVYTDGIHARNKGQATNPYEAQIFAQHPLPALDLLEKYQAWQDGWDKAEGKIAKVFD
jgi:hypothetical protein